MAFYVYACPKCQARVDLTHGMLELVLVFCPQCGAHMQRTPQLFGFSMPPMDPGLRNTYEIHSLNRSKYDADKTRREVDQAEHRYAAERRKPT